MVNRTGGGRCRGTGWVGQDGRSKDTHRNILEARSKVVRPRGKRVRSAAEPRRCHPPEEAENQTVKKHHADGVSHVGRQQLKG